MLAIDSDSNPNLATSLGVDRESANQMRSLPSRAFDAEATVAALLDQYSVSGPDGVRLVLAARIDAAASG